MGTEKRKMERFDLELPAWLYVKGEKGKQKPFEYKTKNICAGGAYFDTDSPLAVGTDMKINIRLPFDKLKELRGKKTRIDVSGLVTRTDEQGMAVCFDKKFSIMPNASHGA
jgi:hypothetical protein